MSARCLLGLESRGCVRKTSANSSILLSVGSGAGIRPAGAMNPWAAYLANQVACGNPTSVGGPQGGGAQSQGAHGQGQSMPAGSVQANLFASGAMPTPGTFMPNGSFGVGAQFQSGAQGGQVGGGSNPSACLGSLPYGGNPQGPSFPFGFGPQQGQQFGSASGFGPQFTNVGNVPGVPPNFGCAGLRPPPGFYATTAPTETFTRAQGDAAARATGLPLGTSQF